MKKLINFLLVFVLMCSLVSCSHFQSTKEPTIDEPTTSQKETTSVKEENISFSEDWRDFKVKVNDVVITLPITYKDFCEKTGCFKKTYKGVTQVNSSIGPGRSYGINTHTNKNNDGTITIYLYNHTQEKLSEDECLVVGVIDSISDYENGPSGVVFSKDISVGREVDDELLEWLGNPELFMDYYKPFYLGDIEPLDEDGNITIEYNSSEPQEYSSYFYGTIVDDTIASCGIMLSPTDEAFILPE